MIEEKLCTEKHENIEDKFENHQKRLDKHSDEIDDIKSSIGLINADNREFKTKITDLCKQLTELTTTIRWFIGLMVGGFVGFFFYAVQQGVL